MEKKTAVITGATGFLGYALLLDLLANDYFVYVLCRKNSKRLGRLKGLKNISIIETDLFAFTESLDIKRCDIFFHLAWEGGRNNFEEQYKNIEMTLNCLKLAIKLHARRFLCTGSQAEYGETTKVITEETILNPITSYGAAKVAAYYLARDLAEKSGIILVWARMFSVYGEHDNPNSLIPKLRESFERTGKAQLSTDGTHIWNYLYEADAARALRMLGESRADGVFNVASNISKPLVEYVHEISEDILVGEEKSGVNLNVSIEKLRSIIGEWEMEEFGTIVREKNLWR